MVVSHVWDSVFETPILNPPVICSQKDQGSPAISRGFNFPMGLQHLTLGHRFNEPLEGRLGEMATTSGVMNLAGASQGAF